MIALSNYRPLTLLAFSLTLLLAFLVSTNIAQAWHVDGGGWGDSITGTSGGWSDAFGGGGSGSGSGSGGGYTGVWDRINGGGPGKSGSFFGGGSSNSSGGGYTGVWDRINGGGPGKSGSFFGGGTAADRGQEGWDDWGRGDGTSDQEFANFGNFTNGPSAVNSQPRRTSPFCPQVPDLVCQSDEVLKEVVNYVTGCTSKKECQPASTCPAFSIPQCGKGEILQAQDSYSSAGCPTPLVCTSKYTDATGAPDIVMMGRDALLESTRQESTATTAASQPLRFEVAVLEGSNTTITEDDWQAVTEIAVESTDTLHFRWLAKEYDVCLANLNPAKYFSFDATNVEGNTYDSDVDLRTATAEYSVECKLGSSNEKKTISVTVVE